MRADPEPLPHRRTECRVSGSGPSSLGFAGGTEWVVDARHCRVDALCDPDLILSLCQAVIDELGLKVVGQPQCHQFPDPAGVTALYLLSESHLACHTYPEHRFATFNLYCCRHRACWDWQRQLAERLGAERVTVREIDRSAVEPPTGRQERLR